MGNQVIKQAVLTSQAAVNANCMTEPIALFNEDGDAVSLMSPAALVTTATAIGTAGKTTTSDEPAAGSLVPIKFTNGNSANSPTVAFNGGSARAIQLGGTASTGAKMTVAANGVVVFYFDGTVLHQLGTVA